MPRALRSPYRSNRSARSIRSQRELRASLPRCVYWMTVPTATSLFNSLPLHRDGEGWRDHFLVATLRGVKSLMVWDRHRDQMADAVIEALRVAPCRIRCFRMEAGRLPERPASPDYWRGIADSLTTGRSPRCMIDRSFPWAVALRR